MSTPAAFDTTLLVPAASAGSQPSGSRSPWSPVGQDPRRIATPIVELAEMEGGRSATIRGPRTGSGGVVDRVKSYTLSKFVTWSPRKLWLLCFITHCHMFRGPKYLGR